MTAAAIRPARTEIPVGAAPGACRVPEAAAAFELAGVPLHADLSGALYAPDDRVLVVADLHLEKGSAFARRRMLVPPYDTAMTLARLAAVIAAYVPRTVIALGDSFHDDWGPGRLGDADRAALLAMQAGRTWLWVAGNHDRAAPSGCGGEAVQEIRLGSIELRHQPTVGAAPEIAGHLHPAARVVARSGSVRRRCFVTDRRRCVMPAFGAYAGGLNLRDAAFAPLFAVRSLTALVLGRDRVHAVAGRFCVPDPR